MAEKAEAQAARDFPADIAAHVMTVRLDREAHRHVEFGQPHTNNRRFYITTWPGALCISGDMGTFVFERTRDMFEFFRKDTMRVNLPYWSEKLVATNVSNGHGHEEYSADLFRERIRERLDEWAIDHLDESDDEGIAELRESVADEVLSQAESGEYAAHLAARDFRFRDEEVFTDFWETHLREFTYHFAWCCHAIVWAIQQYDAQHGAEQLQAAG